MSRNKTVVKAIYGNTMIPKEFCQSCNKWAFVIDNRLSCCDEIAPEPTRETTKRESEGEHKRSQLSEGEKREILEAQENKCFYCHCDLKNTWYIRKKMKRPRLITIHYDHVIPWAYSRETIVHGMVASCNICNLLKGSKYFDNEIEALEYIRKRRINKGIEIL